MHFRYLFFVILFLKVTAASAGIVAGVGYYSWQEKVFLDSDLTGTGANATFTSIGPSVGLEGLIDPRLRFGINFTYHTGSIDVIKSENFSGAQHYSFKAYWFGGYSIYRITKSFGIGPQFISSQKKYSGLAEMDSFGLFINAEYILSDETKFIQSIGSMGTTGLFAYSLILEHLF